MQALIVLLPGDGIGPEVTAEAERVLTHVAGVWGHEFHCERALFGGAAIDATGSPFPPETRTLAGTAHAVLLGAVGGPRWSDPGLKVRPEQGLLSLRKSLGAFANLRPVKPHAALAASSPLREERLLGTDLLFVRELTGGAYFGAKTRTRDADGNEHAVDHYEYTTKEIERVVRVAGNQAQHRSGRLLSVDKANVLETSRLWRQVTTRVMADEFPDVVVEHQFVDAFAMQLMLQPSRYDVIVTENLFGDILTDEAAVLVGSIGLLPSASLGTPLSDGRYPGIYEPIHGSAPDIAGQNVANPVGAILSVAMMLRHALLLEAEAQAVEDAVGRTLRDGWRTADCAAGVPPCTTSTFTDHVIECLQAPVPA
jgi:3-isopropylmalate dehydrogenase